jgi:hypothetical protein
MVGAPQRGMWDEGCETEGAESPSRRCRRRAEGVTKIHGLLVALTADRWCRMQVGYGSKRLCHDHNRRRGGSELHLTLLR